MKKSEIKILLIGTGLLGKSISEKLLIEKFDLSVWNRTKSKCKDLILRGAKEISKINNISNKINTLILVLKDGDATYSIIEKIKNIDKKVIIQMGTIGTSHSEKVQSLVQSRGGNYLESPVLGSVPEALAGELLIMVGGDKLIYQKIKILLETLSKKIIYFDSAKKAASCKLALNYQIASLTYNFSLVFRYLNESKIEIDLFMDFLRNSALYAPTYDKKLERIKNRDYKNGNFNIDNLAKDVNLFMREIKRMQINGKSIELLDHILSKYEISNFNNLDYSCLHEFTSK